MSRYDPTIEVICDKCGEGTEWNPQYVYHSYSGGSGHFDTSDSAFEEWCKSEGWEHRGENEDICDSCLADEEED